MIVNIKCHKFSVTALEDTWQVEFSFILPVCATYETNIHNNVFFPFGATYCSLVVGVPSLFSTRRRWLGFCDGGTTELMALKMLFSCVRTCRWSIGNTGSYMHKTNNSPMDTCLHFFDPDSFCISQKVVFTDTREKIPHSVFENIKFCKLFLKKFFHTRTFLIL